MSAEKETYVRRRAFNKIHVTSWLIYLEKDGFVRCPFQNCNFMAFDVNEMCEHYGFCKGESSFSKFVCEVCKGYTNSEKKLHEHRSRAHNITISPEQANASAEVEEAGPGKPSRVLMLSWSFFFDKHNYIKCTNCQYIANTMSDMCRHYLACKQDKKFLRYVCPKCKGRTRDVAPLLSHLQRAHTISMRPDQFNHISRNMVQFWEKELREEKYATCLHINTDKKRDCQYIDIDLLGINEHSQTCKGPQQIKPLHNTTPLQWHCQFCEKWTISEDKLNKHHLLTHCKLYNSITLEVEQNHLSDCPETADIQSVKREALNNSHENPVPRQFTPENKLLAFQSKDTTDSRMVNSSDPVHPFESVYIKVDVEHPQGVQKTPVRRNSTNQSHSNHLQSENIAAHNTSSAKSLIKKYNTERNRKNSLQNHANINGEASKMVANVNTNQQPVIEESADKNLKNSIQEHQEIFLDLVEDKLVPRTTIGEDCMALPSSVADEKACKGQSSSLSTREPSTNKNLEQFEDQAIEIIDVAEDNFSLGISNIQSIELEALKVEKEIDIDEECEVVGSSSLQSSMSSICVHENNTSLLFEDDETNIIDESLPETISLNQSQKEIEVTEDENRSSTMRKDYVKEGCEKKENSQFGSKNIVEGQSKTKKTHCVLFKDNFSSDEEDCAEKCKDGLKENEIKPSFDWLTENKSLKSYTRRKSTDDKPERCSPTKSVSSVYMQKNQAETKHSNSDVVETEKGAILTYKGRKGCNSPYKSQMQAKNTIFVKNRIHCLDNSQEEASKNSEKNDKLMLKETSSEHLNKGHSSLSDHNKVSNENEPVSRVRKISVVHQLKQKPIQSGEAKLCSSDGIKVYCNDPVVETVEKSEYIQKDYLKQSSFANNKVMSHSPLSTCKENQKSRSVNLTVDTDEITIGKVNKEEDFIDITEDNSQESPNETKCCNESPSFDLTGNSTNSEIAVIKETETSIEHKVVSFFYSGKLNKPLLDSTISKSKETTDRRKQISESFLEGKLRVQSNELSSSIQADETPSNDIVKIQQTSVERGVDRTSCIHKDNNSSLPSDSSLNLVNHIKADFFVYGSLDEEDETNKKTVGSNLAKNPIITENCMDSTKSETFTVPDQIKTTVNPESLSSKRKSDVRRISSDCCDGSSLDDEDCLGTDEELDTKDHFFNGFKEISENINSKNRRFHQFLNRLSESENEEWYVNAGNLSMDIRKGNSMSLGKSKYLDCNFKCESSGNTDEEMTVIVVDDGSNDKPQDVFVNKNITKGVSNQKRGCEIEFKENNEKYIHKKGFMGDKSHQNKKTEYTSKVKTNDFAKQHSRKSSSSDSESRESLKISLSIDKLNLPCTSKIDSANLQLSADCPKATEIFKSKVNNNSIVNISYKKELDCEDDNVAVKEFSGQLSSQSDQGEEKGSILKSEMKNTSTENSNIVEHCIANSTNNFFNKSDQSKEDVNLNTSISSVKDQFSTVIVKHTEGKETAFINTKEISIMPGITPLNSKTGNSPADNPNIRNSPNLSQLMPTQTLSPDYKTSALSDVDGQLVCSTPKQKETTIIETLSDHTDSSSTENYNSPLSNKRSSPTSKFDATEYSDDESLSVVQKKCKTSAKAVHGKKGNLLTEGFSPHESTQENELHKESIGRMKPAHLIETSTDVLEIKQNYRNVRNTDVVSCERINIENNGAAESCENMNIKNNEAAGTSKTKGSIQIGSQVKHGISNGENGSTKKTLRNEAQKIEEISAHLIINDNGIPDTGIREQSITASAREHGREVDNSRSLDCTTQIKRRGRPPKRKSKEISNNLNESDLNSFYDHMNENELLLSIYSEEVENVLTGVSLQNKIRTSERVKEDQSVLVGLDSVPPPKESNHVLCNNEIIVHKKRGRPAKLKLESNNSPCILKTTSPIIGDVDCQLDKTKYRYEIQSLQTEKNNHDKESKLPKKKRGRPARLKFESSGSEQVAVNSLLNNETECADLVKNKLKEESIPNRDSSGSEVSKKRRPGRPPKMKLGSISSDCTPSTAKYSRSEHTFQNNETECTDIVNDTIEKSTATKVPKKRGRPPRSKLVCDVDKSFTKHNIELPEIATLQTLQKVPKKRGRKPGSKLKLNSDMNGTASKVSSITDIDYNGSVASELLGTDVILINEEKVNSSHSSDKRLRKCKDIPQKLGDCDDDSDGNEPEQSFGSDDTDEDSSYEIPRQSKKRKLNADNLGTDKKPDSKRIHRGGKKSRVMGGEKTFFKTTHHKDDKVVCGACKQEMTYASYKNYHAVAKHYMLTWLEGEEDPVDMTNQKDVENRLWFCKKRMGKAPFYCPMCRLPKLSAVGFYSHILFCGKNNEEKESLLATCEVCGTRLMPASLKSHMHMKHAPKEPRAEVRPVEPVVGKGLRAAAARAVEVMQRSQRGDAEDEGDVGSRSNSPERKSHLHHLYSRPSKQVPVMEYRRWKVSLAETRKVVCANEGCKFSALSTVAFRKHYLTCSFTPPRLYKCRVCSFTSPTEDPMVEHVEERHDNDEFAGADESSDESDGGEQKLSKPVYSGSSLPFKFLKALKHKLGRHVIKKRFFTAALTWTLNMRENMFASETVFPEVQAEPEQWLTPKAAVAYLPEETESIKFRGSDGTWQTLQRFQSCRLDGVAMLFAGGPVWATAWAPVPYPEEHQYLAVATHTSMERTHAMSSIYNYAGVIQIWLIGRLRNLECLDSSPRLMVGLTHQRGPVWGLAWCPAGAYSQERLGLLAAACGDGSIVVYAVAHNTDAIREPLACCAAVKPVWDLRLGCEMMAQCTCVDWHSAAPHSIIAGGFANGMVALWDLNTTSPLLKNQSTILPYKVIEAHHSAVTAVQLSCSKEEITLMTASLDRATKFWRLDDTTTMVNYLKKASVTKAVMTNHWLLSISAYDDVYSINSSHVTGYSYRETFTTGNINFIIQPGTVWGLSFNDWLNGCACASEMGKVNAFFRQQLLVSEDSKKVNKSTLVEDVVVCTPRSIRDGSPVTSDFGTMYKDCSSKIGLEFSFGENIKAAKPASFCSSDNMSSFPIRSFNTVTWNPNMDSFTWLAAGMQCGLVVVQRIASVRREDLAELHQHKDYR